MFFFDDQLARRRVEDIKMISAGRIGTWRGAQRVVHDIEMIDGTRMVVPDITVTQISRVPCHIFAAEPGLRIWAPDPEGGADFFQPVVGWGVTVDGNVVPLAPGGSINDIDGCDAIIASDGAIWQNGFVQAPDLETFKQLRADDEG